MERETVAIIVVSKGKTLTWLDDCRIPFNKETDEQPRIRSDKTKTTTKNGTSNVKYGGYGNVTNKPYFNDKGRFPANLLVSDSILGDHSRYFDLDKWYSAKFDDNPSERFKLLCYLITLGSREGDLILDPFDNSEINEVVMKMKSSRLS